MERWKQQLNEALTSLQQLCEHGYMSADDVRAFADVNRRYRLRIPHYYLALIDKTDPNDPIAKMAIPSLAEIDDSLLYDPIGDLMYEGPARLTHRYKNRALIHLTAACAMYCRFCFRKNVMNETDAQLYRGSLDPAFAYIATHTEIDEVIFSGGDPLVFDDRALARLIARVDTECLHVKRIRFHTRMAVTLPDRITASLVAALASRCQVVIVSHFNHPRELTVEACAALARLKRADVLSLNQTVLLKGVNDEIRTLEELFLTLGNNGCLPYYLHHCDQVTGGAHFRVSLDRGRVLWRALRGILPGYLIPEYVLDVPGGKGKVAISADTVTPLSEHRYSITTANGVQIYSDI